MNCPACRSTNYKFFSDFKVPQDKTNDILPPDFRLLVCSNCNLFFKDYIPTEEELKLYYRSLDIKTWEYSVVYPHEKYLNNLMDQLPDGSKVLDVGCFTGRLLQNQVGRLNCSGIEINSNASEIATAKGINVIGASIVDFDFKDEKFDFITLIDVFEHLRDPMPVIHSLTSALSIKGKLFIFTGRTDCFPVMLTKSHFVYFRLAEHLIFLNRKFTHWMEKAIKGIHIQYIPMNHFFFNWHSFWYQLFWHTAWRFFSPNSPYKIIGLKRFQRLKLPFQMSNWKDHVMLIIGRQ